MLKCIIRAANVGLAGYATYLDSLIAKYFLITIQKCQFQNKHDCYCEATNNDFKAFERVDPLDSVNCNNIFVRKPVYLVVNTIFTGICAVLLFICFANFIILCSIKYSNNRNTS